MFSQRQKKKTEENLWNWCGKFYLILSTKQSLEKKKKKTVNLEVTE